jgi:hypothetical protein
MTYKYLACMYMAPPDCAGLGDFRNCWLYSASIETSVDGKWLRDFHITRDKVLKSTAAN